MNATKRNERLQKWNTERQPALIAEMFSRVMNRADETARLPHAIREINRRIRDAVLRENQERAQ